MAHEMHPDVSVLPVPVETVTRRHFPADRVGPDVHARHADVVYTFVALPLDGATWHYAVPGEDASQGPWALSVTDEHGPDHPPTAHPADLGALYADHGQPALRALDRLRGQDGAGAGEDLGAAVAAVRAAFTA